MKRVTSYAALLQAQKQFFETTNLNQREAVESLAKATADDLKEFTSGNLTPKETKGAFARGPIPHTGGIRRRGPRRRVRRLPINIQSGKLHGAVIFRYGPKSSRSSVFFAGFAKSAGGGIFTVIPGGTRKMIDRGLYGPNGEISKRVAARRKAFRDQYLRKQSKQ